MSNNFFRAIGLVNPTPKKMADLSRNTGIPLEKLRYYNDLNILPDLSDLAKIERELGINQFAIMIEMEVYNKEFSRYLKDRIQPVVKELSNKVHDSTEVRTFLQPAFTTEYGRLYQEDCITLMKTLEDESVDVIFADPPFNLNKFYLSGIDDSLTEVDYISWCEKWIEQCIRILKTGGTFYLWNLPKWNSSLADFLNKRLFFKHWIASDIKYTLPIQGRLYPSHYSLLMYTKGVKARTFHPDRLPMETCNNCYKEIKDYGGYKNKMNSKGINMSDVWYDIPPVRHKKYKARKEANELSIKLLDRVIEMSSNPGDVIFDPFGGSGTTYVVSEMKRRRWIGVEIGPVEGIIERFLRLKEEAEYLQKIRSSYNQLFPEKIKAERKKRKIWTEDTFKSASEQLVLVSQ